MKQASLVLSGPNGFTKGSKDERGRSTSHFCKTILIHATPDDNDRLSMGFSAEKDTWARRE